MRAFTMIIGLLIAGCTPGGPTWASGHGPIYEPDCSEEHLIVPMPPIWSLNECWDECCMYSYMGCQQTYCYWVGDYDCYWERAEVYCW